MHRFLSNVLFALKQFVYPPRCVLCDRYKIESETRFLCSGCSSTLKKLDADFTAPHLNHTWFDRARSLFPFEGKVRDVLHGFKYEQRFDLVRFFVNFLEAEAKNMGRFDLVVPVPLHPKRLRGRGFNQASLIARPLAKKLNCDCDIDALVRVREVGPQVGRELKDRLKAVKGIFELGNVKKVKGKQILIIDDVLTTGATVNECSRILKKGGASCVDVLTIARPI